MNQKSNKLINEKSPYLLQHAYNPVNWFAWTDEAFEKAKSEDKPIFLSIGYSTCHWCHVMERESFEDEEVAQLMNDTFVSIKVDREERPDIDGIYMSVCQMMTGSGGWPLTVVMTPDKKPFFAGTYFPKHNRFNRIGMMELIPKLKSVWINQKDEVLKSADEIAASLSKQSFISDKVEIDDTILDKAYEELLKRYDETHGGFGSAPKFPSPHNLIFLLRYWKRKTEPKALEMVEKTLTEMRRGGIYDHIGFGFARYSTDQQWLVPHFEKMLYDQAMLVMAYIETYLATKNQFYKNTAEEILEYVLRDMTHPEGGFYSAEDADSEGEEGKFYLWGTDELRNVLDKDEYSFVIKVFNASDNGNWTDESKGIMTGTNILHLKKSSKALAEEFNISEELFSKKLDSIRKKLFDYRKKRIHPHKDDKILTDWNGLMISAFAKAAQAFNNKRYADAAEESYSFIQKYLMDNDGKLIHRFRDGESGLPAHIDDYAFIINALIDLYETTFEIKFLKQAVELNKILLKDFWDQYNGGFYFTSSTSEKLITRQKDVYDGAIPSGNSIALLNLIKLSRFTSDINFENTAAELVKYFSGYISRSPSAFCMFMCGLDLLFSPSTEIVIVSEQKDNLTIKAIELIRNIYNPNKVVVLKSDNNHKDFAALLSFTKDMNMKENNTTFYVCRDYKCNQPVNTIEELEKLLLQ
ncbi:MAG TPA: thioredoxin domain-containing protein [Ignavibacteriaceae bacterium]|nr:thioredoxin domain-containing protein [Ignavibacteriaceae bacterium]